MNINETGEKGTVTKATVNGLAIVGFTALILGGVFLAVYAASYVPQALSRLAGAVSLSTQEPQNTDTETPSTTTTKNTDTNDAQTKKDTTDTVTTTDTTPKTGGPLLVPQQPRVIYNGPRLYGLPDLAIVSIEGGYFRNGRFVEDNDVPNNRDAGVRFIVQNLGTNTVSDFRIKVEVEGEDDALGVGGLLYPNGTQLFTVRISDPKEGERLDVDVSLDYQNRIAETNERNNDESVRLDIDD